MTHRDDTPPAILCPRCDSTEWEPITPTDAHRQRDKLCLNCDCVFSGSALEKFQHDTALAADELERRQAAPRPKDDDRG